MSYLKPQAKQTMPKRLIKYLLSERKDRSSLAVSHQIELAASESQLPIDIVASVILQESGGNPWAVRYEPGFYDRRIKHRRREELAGFVPRLLPTLNTEKTLRSTSFGLMQVMGETARVVGYEEPYLTQLCRIEDNLSVGCKYMRQLFDKAVKLVGAAADETAIWTQVLTWYNGSSEYPKLIFAIRSKGLYRKLLDGTSTQEW